MSGKYRGRRTPSPSPLHPAAQAPQASQRFPPRQQGMLSADERRDAARLEPKGSLPRRTQYPPGGLRLTGAEWKLLIGISVVAVLVRLFRLSRPNSVVFDEVHFGKFAAKYIKTQYFVDVHPPLAKLLITLAAFVGGYDGQFDFKDIAKVYENTPYVMMRLLPAALGVGLVPITYLTLRALDCRATTALLGSLFVTFENGLVTQSRHILLDSPLVFFTGLTTFFWVAFANEDSRGEPFSDVWWAWLTLTGLGLGAVVSCKWVGLFTIATIGACTIRQLWLLLGDLRVTPRMFFRHFAARALCLIVIPIVFYMFMFQIHFLILQNSGDGDGFMSSEFQHTLGGKDMEDTFADVGIGSEVTLRHWNTQGGYLHSHGHDYPGGSKQQQVTLYPHRDTNNNFLIINASDTTEIGADIPDFRNHAFVPITPHMKIRLHHITTDKRVHSHDVRPPISEVEFQNEVSAYGFAGLQGDANDDWIVEIDEGESSDRESWKRIRTLRTKFKLRHAITGCYLFSHKVKLPEWGFEQQEVTCNKNAVRDNSLWFIETNIHHSLGPKAEKLNYRLPGFFSKFFELQKVMWTTNAGLTDRHAFDSRPQSWPRLTRGINFWVKDHRQIYLIGNPIVWWLSTAAVLAYGAVRGFLILREKRGYKDFNNSGVVKYDQLCGFLMLGWALHYFPFFLMQRQLFLHHYFPALYYAILLFCGVFDLATAALRPKIRLQVAAVLIIIAIWNYQHFSPLAYGGAWTKAKCENARWLKTWDFACNDFLDDISLYKGPFAATPPKSSSSPVATIDGAGRAPVVVQEPFDGQAAQDEQATSSFIEKIEPGHDIFAPKDGDQKPESKVFDAPPRAEDEESKEISSVHQTAAPGAPSAPIAEPENPRDISKERAAELEAQALSHTSTSAPAPEEPSSSEKAAAPPLKHPAGPLDEAEAEAEKAREELYPTGPTGEN